MMVGQSPFGYAHRLVFVYTAYFSPEFSLTYVFSHPRIISTRESLSRPGDNVPHAGQSYHCGILVVERHDQILVIDGHDPFLG